mgnify:CR=1 FL=1
MAKTLTLTKKQEEHNKKFLSISPPERKIKEDEMLKAELEVREAEIRANDIAESNRELSRDRAISRLMLLGMRRKEAEQEFNDQVAYFMRGIDGYDKAKAIEAAADVILYGDEISDSHEAMRELWYG